MAEEISLNDIGIIKIEVFMNEIWKDIEGYEGLYQVSNLGRVKSLITNKILKLSKDKCGYLKVTLCLNTKAKTVKIHRLVCQAFLHNPEQKPEVNHINGIKEDNRLENLEWATRSENMSHAFRFELASSKKPIKGINLHTLQEVIFESQKAAAVFIGSNNKNISKVCLGLRKQTKGWTFQYLEEVA